MVSQIKHDHQRPTDGLSRGQAGLYPRLTNETEESNLAHSTATP
jgi:hypothetical protein